MRWYEGNISQAVATSKTNGAVFVVYIEGKDNKSKDFTDLINNDDVSAQLEGKYFVAIKIEENSIPHQQFSEIYKNAKAPSIFFIGKTGSPLEIITELYASVDFLKKLQAILQKHGVNITISKSTDNFIDEEKHSTTNSDANIKEASPSTSDVIDSEELTAEEKIERAQELINRKRLEKQADEDAKERQKEIERRKVGQDVQKLKRWQQDQEIKDMMEERNKEKKEQLEARQRVLAQIAQDKAERAAKFSNVSHNAQASTTTSQQIPSRNNNIARLQFKFPDGSTHTHEFPSSDTLQTVRNYIMKNLDVPYPNFTLSTTFPRREFTANNHSETLLDLQLVPNAVILILPLQRGTVSTHEESSLSTTLWSILAPLLQFMRYLKMKLFGGGSPTSSAPPQNTNQKVDTSPASIKKGETTVIRRQGNVHRLQDNTDSDEDNNTWNGNSTQQM
ncbi:hypothetical protein FQR65_LT03283 [Abscondita terminalis]|nr:hypothetical protein FQR65_LT03283 [Abscondita terminalis]